MLFIIVILNMHSMSTVQMLSMFKGEFFFDLTEF